MNNQLEIKNFFNRDGVKNKLAELLGSKAPQFITSVMQVVNGNNYLQKATPESIYNAAAMAAVLDLPINNNLGFAWIVPYGNQAQFQIAARGYIQLAHRTREYQDIGVIEVYKSQFESWNPITNDLKCDFSKEEDEVIGYFACFRLNNGFAKAYYWSKTKTLAHGKKYSKSFNSGPWKDETDKMCKKTVLKHLLKDWGLLSLEMQQAIVADQGVINDIETMDIDYVDGNDIPETKKESLKPAITDENIQMALNEGMTIAQLQTTYELTDQQLLTFG